MSHFYKGSFHLINFFLSCVFVYLSLKPARPQKKGKSENGKPMLLGVHHKKGLPNKCWHRESMGRRRTKMKQCMLWFAWTELVKSKSERIFVNKTREGPARGARNQRIWPRSQKSAEQHQNLWPPQILRQVEQVWTRMWKRELNGRAQFVRVRQNEGPRVGIDEIQLEWIAVSVPLLKIYDAA